MYIISVRVYIYLNMSFVTVSVTSLFSLRRHEASQIHWHESRLAQSLAFLAAQVGSMDFGWIFRGMKWKISSESSGPVPAGPTIALFTGG